MAIVRLHKDALNPQRSDVVHVGAVSLLPWLRDNAPWADVVVRNGQQLDELTDVELCEFDTIDVFKVPRQGLAWYWQLAIGVGVAALSYALTPKPEMPNGMGKPKESPNNKLNAATNQFRPRQAIPHIFGRVRSYPDFIQPSYYYYDGGLKVQKEVFLVTHGYANLSNPKSSDTPITDWSYYKPNDTLPEFLNVRSTNEINNFELLPPDQFDTAYSTDNGTISDGGITVGGKGVVKTLLLQAGDTIDIQFIGESLSGDAVNLNVQRTINTILNENSFTVTTVIPTNVAVANGFLHVTLVSGTNDRTQWFTLSGREIEQVWFHLVAPQGLRTDTGDELTVQCQLQVQAINAVGTPVGEVIESFGYLTGRNTDAIYQTFRIEGLPPSRYRARVLRNTLSQPVGSIDKVVLEDIVSVTPINTSAYGEVTILDIERVAGIQQSGGGQSKVNVEAFTELPIFDPNTGTFGALAETRSAAQAVMYILVYLAGESLDNIDYESLFDAVPDNALGYFDMTFDDKDVSVEQAVQTILNAARCYHYFVAGKWSFGRDEKKPVRSALFNRRNTIPESSQQSYTFYRNQDFDSVEVKYVDPTSNEQAYIRRRINATTGAIEEGIGEYVNEIDLAGCRNIGQATNRAEMEIRKIKYVWLNVKDTVTSEGLLVGLGDRVGWCDINDSATQDGEILAFDGVDVFTTSEPVTFESGVTYYAYIVEGNGDVTPQFQVQAVAGEQYKFKALETDLVPAIADGYEVQQGSLYVIAPLTALNAQDFTVVSRSKPDENGNVTLELVNYDERVYEQDDAPIPEEELTLIALGGTATVDDTNCVAGQATATVEASGGGGNYMYAWTKISGDGGIISGDNTDTATVEFPSVCPESTSSGVFRCTVSAETDIEEIDVVFSVENVATAPALAVNVTGGVGGTMSPNECPIVQATAFASASGGSLRYTYAWTKLSGDGTIVSGASSDTCTVEFSAVCPLETVTGVYRVTVDDGIDTVFEDVTFRAFNKG